MTSNDHHTNGNSNDPPPMISYRYDRGTPASIAVLRTICVIENVNPIEAPTELEFVLHDYLDPDALNELMAQGSGTGDITLSFEISTTTPYTIEISNDRWITVECGTYQ